MSDLRELYQTTILDHNRRPRNFRRIEGSARHADGYNPLCGDKVSVQVEVENDRVRDVAFQGAGCAISTASASLMTEAVKGRTLAEAEDLFQRFHELLTGEAGSGTTDAEKLGKLAVFSGVREFPVRVKCATLAWHTLRAALEERAETVKTE
jgi:nitrogen fixation NifU-like protein